MKFSGHIKELYINTHFTTGKNVWPPDQPKHFTTLVLLQQQDQPTQEFAMALEEQSTSENIVDIIAMANNCNSYHHKYAYKYYQQPKILQEQLKNCKIPYKMKYWRGVNFGNW